ncbi:hypothetical protein XANCAGTX0491_007383 [Xanthoria calcicola]
MSARDIALQDVERGDPLDHTSPLLNDVSSNSDRRPRNSRPSSRHRSTWTYKRQDKLSDTTKTPEGEDEPLLREDFVPISVLTAIDDGPRFATLEYLAPWFPEADPTHPKAQTWRTWRSKREIVLRGCSIVAVVVLVINLAATVYLKVKWKTTGDLGTIYRGKCSKAQQLSSRLHIVINILSIILLSISNVCMQLLAAPTRQEIDEAHGKFIWLDIGVPSFRNLWHINIKRRVILIFLAVTSIPLHFFYNSTIIPTVAVNTYAYIAVSSEFLHGGAWNTSEIVHPQLGQYWERNMTGLLQTWHGLDLQSTIQSMQLNAKNGTSYAYVNTLDCLLMYNDLMGNRSDLIMVSSAPPEENNTLLVYGMAASGTWDTGYVLCQWPNTFDCGRLAELPVAEQVQAVQDWNMGGYKIDHCLSSQRSTENLCSVEYSFSILLIVCIFNFLKCIGICYTARYHSTPDDRPLVNIGDAICSFLQDPDKTTRGMSLVSKQQIAKSDEIWRTPTTQMYQFRQPRWLYAVSWKRWSLCIGLALVIIITATIFLATGITGLKNRNFPTDIHSLLSMGFGAVHPKSLVGFITPSPSAKSLYLSVGFSNLWQFAISLLYLAYNGVLTAMLVANEWDEFGKTRKTLRLTSPQGIQRSSYFISVPLKYGLPVLVAFGALHYTISQSVFVVYLVRFLSNGEEDVGHRSATSGYSCFGSITSLVLGFALVLLLILAGFLGKYKNGTPLASTCSAAISAACHRPSRDTQAHMFQLYWGAVSWNPQTHIGHCCFTTAKDVTGEQSRPVPGCLYS